MTSEEREQVPLTIEPSGKTGRGYQGLARAWGEGSWFPDQPYSRPIYVIRIKKAEQPSFYHHLGAAALPVFLPPFQLQQVAFRITTHHLHLLSMASVWIALGFTFYPGQDRRECGAGQGALAGLHFCQLHQGLLMLFHDLGKPGVWRGADAVRVWERVEFPLEKTQVL